jgi:hypothetical protein
MNCLGILVEDTCHFVNATCPCLYCLCITEECGHCNLYSQKQIICIWCFLKMTVTSLFASAIHCIHCIASEVTILMLFCNAYYFIPL